MKQKIICIDWGIFSHRAIFAYGAGLKRKQDNPNEYVLPSDYTCLMMIFSALRKIGVNADVDDQVYICVDSFKSNWRKIVDPSYKDNRKAVREKSLVNWKTEFEKMNELLEAMEIALPFHIIQIEGLECDDIIAETVRYYKDKEVIVVSYDCLGGNTPIKMAQGNSKRLANVQPKDKVLTYNFETKKFEEGTVTEIHRVTHDAEYHIYYENYRIPIKSSANHLFLTKKGWKKAKDLLVKDILLHYKEKNIPVNNLQNGLKIKKIEIMNKPNSRPFFHYDLTVVPNHNYIINDKIIVHNCDFQQLLIYDNVKIFSTHPASKKCPYKILDLDRDKEKTLAFKSLAKKIEKEASDNLVSELVTEEDFDKRESIVSLLSLPEFVTIPIKQELDKIKNVDKDFDLTALPFQNTMPDRFRRIFQEDGIITYEKCRKYKKKKLRLKKLKAKKVIK